jgi:Domain of unknown function (DUF222)
MKSSSAMKSPPPEPSLSACSLAELEAQITELAGQLNAANYRWLMLIGEFDRRQGWWDGSLHSCAHWLNFKCGLDLGAAREKVRVAGALPGVPKIAAAMARGELSYSKVRALTRVATPATEENLLMIALHGTAYHVEKVVRLFRRAQEAEERPLSYASRRADALARVAEGYLQNPVDSAEVSTADRYQVVVHVDAETLKEQSAGRCHLEHGPTLPAETVRRLSCDASLVRILETERGEPLDVGRKTRSIPPAIRRALNARDPGCCFPGCTYQRYLDAHHVEHWVDGGETKLKNLVHLCRTHHRLVHEGGITVAARAGGGWRFARPDGREFELPQHDPAASAVDWTALRDTHAQLGIEIDRDTAATRWRGERMDYELGVWVLCHQHERAQHAGSQVESNRADDPASDRAGDDWADHNDPASNAANDVSAETQRWWAT